MSESDELDIVKLKEVDRVVTPHNIKQKCFDLCKDYVSGDWIKISLESMEFKRIRGGLTNQIYYCALPCDNQSNNNKLKEVVIKFYERKHTSIPSDGADKKNERFNDNIISLLIATHGLGPKIHGIFNEGIIMEFIKGRTLDLLGKDNENLVLLGKIAQKLAHIHSLKIPIEKKPNAIFSLMRNYLEEGNKSFPLKELMQKYKCDTILRTDFIKQIKWIEKYVNHCKSPVVFTHNDFRQANILIGEESDYKLTFIDFEYSSYTFRAMDFGVFFTEFNRTSLLFADFPEKEKVMNFLSEYRNESIKIFGHKYEINEQNSLESLLIETKTSYILQILYMVLFCIKSGEELGLGLSKEFLMKTSEQCMKYYFEMKKQFMDEKNGFKNFLLNE